MSRRGWIATAVAVVAALAAAVALLAGGDEQRTRAADPLAAASAYIQRDLPIVAVVDTGDLADLLDRFPGADFALDALGLPLPAGVLREQLGGPLVVGSEPRADTWTAAFVARDPDALRRASDRRLAVDGDVAVLAATPRLAQAALAVRRAGRGTAARRVTGTSIALSADAVDALRRRAALPDLGVGAATVGATLDARGIAFTLGGAVTDPRLLPLAPGPQPPRPAGEGPITLALRDPKPALRALLRTDGARQLDAVRTALRRYLRADLDELVLDRLTGTATVTVDGETTTIRAPLTDGGGLRDALGRAARVPGFVLDVAGVGDFDLAEADGRFVLTRDELPLFALGVERDVLVVSTDAGVDVARVAARRPRRVAGAGSLRLRVGRDEVVRRLLERFALPPIAGLGLGPVGDLTLSLRAERDRVTGAGRLALAP